RAVFSPDGKLLATTGDDSAIHLWDPATGKEVRKWDVGGSGNVAFSPDGKVIATAIGAAVRRWEVATGKEIGASRDHHRAVFVLRWSPDGKTMFSYGFDKRVLEWD